MGNKPFDVMIVEDEALLVMDMEFMVEDAGHQIVAEAASLIEVRSLPDSIKPDLAFVDVQLARGSSGLDVCSLIRERWPDASIVFVTANPAMVPDDFCGALGVIPKPFSRTGLTTAMRYIQEGVNDPPPMIAQPSSFIAFSSTVSAWA